ncbi:MAG: TIGR02452 family protein [Thiotrichaceae bacterium]|nr:TIGR02452 family protein [Thiotrichaceae bacterium]
MKNNKQKNSRSKRSNMASETLSIIEKGYYDVADKQVSIKKMLGACNQNTRLYTPDDFAALASPSNDYSDSTIEVVNETTLQGAKRLLDSGDFKRIAVLNFASAKNAGGGFLGGSQAQEESLARSSALYSSLQQCPTYYHYHRRQNKSLLYSDHMIYSPQCAVFREDTGAMLAMPYAVNFITAPAPNRGAIARNDPKALEKIDAVFSQRIHYMLKLAASQGCDALVLGAWGCGVFGNLPDKVAGYFADALKGGGEYAHAFKYVSFSIPENSKSAANTEAFKAILE